MHNKENFKKIVVTNNNVVFTYFVNLDEVISFCYSKETEMLSVAFKNGSIGPLGHIPYVEFINNF